jgi:hypothetical protein
VANIEDFTRLGKLTAERDKLNAEIAELSAKLGLVPRSELSAGKRQPKMANSKREQMEAFRAEALKRNWVKEDGSPDLERARLEKTAKAYRITADQLRQFRAEHRAEAVKAGLGVPEWKDREAQRLGVPRADIEKHLAQKRFKK